MKKALFFLLLILMVLVFLFVFRGKAPAIKRLVSETAPREAFCELIAQNDFVDLPKDFHLRKGESHLVINEAVDKNSNWYGVVKIAYSVSDYESDSFSFIFTENGKCIFWGEDSSVLPLCGFGDITRDGYIEKVVKSSHYGYSDDDYQKLEVYSIRPDNIKLLLEVHFNFSSHIDPLDFYGVHLKPINKKFELGITKLEKKLHNVYFVWSKEDQRFYAKGPDNEEWEMVFPADNPLLPLEPEK